MTHINQRRDTAANWATANPVLQLGEVGWETDTRKAKLGNGSTAWNALPYAVKPGTAADTTFTPTGSVAATDVQAAIAEVDSEKIAKSTLDANTILYAVTDDTPAALAVAASRIVGRKASGDISAMTAAELWALLAAGAGHPEVLMIAVSDESTAITTGTAKVTFRMPFALTLTEVRASLTITSSSGIPTFDINEDGSTILSTKLTIDAGELTSVTAATPPVISDASLADDASMTIDIDVAGTGAKGAKVYLIGTRA